VAGITREEQQIKKEVLGKCWQYIRDNFHKFKEDKKIKVALELIKKDIPAQLEHSGEVSHNVFFDEMLRKAKEVDE
jgi:hypothetical protein